MVREGFRWRWRWVGEFWSEMHERGEVEVEFEMAGGEIRMRIRKEWNGKGRVTLSK